MYSVDVGQSCNITTVISVDNNICSILLDTLLYFLESKCSRLTWKMQGKNLSGMEKYTNTELSVDYKRKS